MSGHSKWSTIKHKKGIADAKRGKAFTKIIRELTVAAKLGGGDPESNPRLRTVLIKAKNENMPKNNIEKAIKKGTGEIAGDEVLEEITYEGYGPGGCAVIIQTLTDNRRRSVSDIRYILSKTGGNLGNNGSVAWMFENKGLIVIEKSKISEDKIMELALEAGAEDVKLEDEHFEIITSVEDFELVKNKIDEAKLEYSEAEVTPIAKVPFEFENIKDAEKMLSLIETLDDHDDVQNVYTNADFPKELLDDNEDN